MTNFIDNRCGKAVWWNDTGGVTGMHTRLFNVFHDAGDDDIGSISDRIDINLGGILQKSVNQHRLPLGNGKSLCDVSFELRRVIADFHSATTENEARSHQRWKTDFGTDLSGLFHGSSDAVGRLFQVQSLQELLKLFAILRSLNGVHTGSDDRDAGIG